jgi:succinoglycan biosynthesis protein ExoL
MLHAAGASVSLLGFCRGTPAKEIEGIAPLLLGRTEDARLIQRALAVLRASLMVPRWRTAFVGVDAIIARQLETLVLASFARSRHAPEVPLIFECLDIHRLMGDKGPVGRLLRGVERRILPNCQALIVSSPEFVHAHLARIHEVLPPITLMENKVLSFELADRAAPSRMRAAARPFGPPWRIGWYGMIRCARSLRLLADLANSLPGSIEVIIRGRVATNVLSDFDAVVARTPKLSFGGPYDRGIDLPQLYGDVHFAWALDFYEAGGNSDWLLPNRLYEAGLFGAVPIAQREVATGAWLERRGAGALLSGEPEQALRTLFEGLNDARYSGLSHAMAALDESEFVYTAADCRGLVDGLIANDDRRTAHAV